jgi:hypothetical protein
MNFVASHYVDWDEWSHKTDNINNNILSQDQEINVSDYLTSSHGWVHRQNGLGLDVRLGTNSGVEGHLLLAGYLLGLLSNLEDWDSAFPPKHH